MSTGLWVLGLVIFLLMVCGLVQFVRRHEISEEEFEREARRPSLMATGLQELHGFFEPEKKAAVEAVREEKRKTKTTLSGDRPEPGPGTPARRSR